MFPLPSRPKPPQSRYATACERGCGAIHVWSTPTELANARADHVCAPLPQYEPQHLKKGTP